MSINRHILPKHFPRLNLEAHELEMVLLGSLVTIAGVIGMIASHIFRIPDLGMSACLLAGSGLLMTSLAVGLSKLNKNPKPLPFRPGPQGPEKNVQESLKAALDKKDWKEALKLTDQIFDSQKREETLIKIAKSCDSTDLKVWNELMMNCIYENSKVIILHAADPKLTTLEVFELLDNISTNKQVELAEALIMNQSCKRNSKEEQKYLVEALALAYFNQGGPTKEQKAKYKALLAKFGLKD